MINNITISHSSQSFFVEHPRPLLAFKTHTEKALKKLTVSERSVINSLISLRNRYYHLYPSLELIASRVGITPRHVKRIISSLKALGLITTSLRQNNTSLYRLADIFLDMATRVTITHLLPACKWVPIVALVVISNVHGNSYSLQGVLCHPKAINIKSYSSLNSLFYKQRPGFSSLKSYLQEKEGYRTGVRRDPEHEISKKRDIVKQFEQKMHGESVLSPVLVGIDWLTDVARAELSAFPDEALKYGLDKLRFASRPNIRDPFKWFFKLCLEYCSANEIRADWKWASKLEAQCDKTGLRFIREAFNETDKNKKSSTNGKVAYPVYKSSDDRTKKRPYDLDAKKEVQKYLEWLDSESAAGFLRLMRDAVPSFILDAIIFGDLAPDDIATLLKRSPVLAKKIEDIALNGHAVLGFEVPWIYDQRPWSQKGEQISTT